MEALIPITITILAFVAYDYYSKNKAEKRKNGYYLKPTAKKYFDDLRYKLSPFASSTFGSEILQEAINMLDHDFTQYEHGNDADYYKIMFSNDLDKGLVSELWMYSLILSYKPKMSFGVGEWQVYRDFCAHIEERVKQMFNSGELTEDLILIFIGLKPTIDRYKYEKQKNEEHTSVPRSVT